MSDSQQEQARASEVPYTLQLLSLQCLRAQERDGDEICIYLNKKKIYSWEQAGRKMSNQLAGSRSKTCTNELDFTTAEMQIEDALPRDTFIPMQNYQPADFTFHMEHMADIMIMEDDDQIWDRKDDMVGHVFIIEPQDGDHRHVFKWENSMYKLRYRVTLG